MTIGRHVRWNEFGGTQKQDSEMVPGRAAPRSCGLVDEHDTLPVCAADYTSSRPELVSWTPSC